MISAIVTLLLALGACAFALQAVTAGIRYERTAGRRWLPAAACAALLAASWVSDEYGIWSAIFG